VKEISVDLNRHVLVDWRGKTVLMFARERVTLAERATPEDG
jgi:hypothetical protein